MDWKISEFTWSQLLCDGWDWKHAKWIRDEFEKEIRIFVAEVRSNKEVQV